MQDSAHDEHAVIRLKFSISDALAAALRRSTVVSETSLPPRGVFCSLNHCRGAKVQAMYANKRRKHQPSTDEIFHSNSIASYV